MSRFVALATALGLSGCAVGGGETSVQTGAGPALRPTFSPTPGASSDTTGTAGSTGTAADTPTATSRRAGRHPTRRNNTASPAPPSSGVTPQRDDATVTIRDRSHDVSGEITGSPDHVDILDARLSRTGGSYTLVVGFGGVLPLRMGSDGRTQNVVLFADVDGDGQVDYEVMGSLADNGWSGSWRFPDGSEFGESSGVDVRPDGSRLTLSFAADRLGSASTFRWDVASEWGSYSQIAAGTTARDYAPDDGAAAFPS